MGKDGEKREENNGDDNERKVVFDNGHITKEVTSKSKQTYPDNASKDVVGNKFGVVHFANAGDKGDKGADDGHEASQKNSFAAMFGKKIIGLGEMRVIERNFWVREDFLAKEVADPVIGSIAEDGGYG